VLLFACVKHCTLYEADHDEDLTTLGVLLL
jgi:hypothetical protein